MSQGSAIFRREAIEAASVERLGSILIAYPPSRWVLSLLAISFAIVVLLVLGLGHYRRRETVQGQLVPSLGISNLIAMSSGTVTHLSIYDGARVKAGDALVEISVGQDSASMGNTEALVANQLDLERNALESDLYNQKKLSEQKISSLRSKISLLEKQVTEISDQLQIQQHLIDSGRSLLERIRPLSAKGYVSIVQIQEQESSVLSSQAQYKAMTRQLFDAKGALNAAQQELAQLPLDAATKDGDTKRQLATVNQAIVRNEVQRAVVVRAPRDGVVSAVLVKEGQMVRADQPLLAILPTGSTLEAQLLVPSRSIGFVEVGSRVIIRYQAFPYQKFGPYFGHVISVSRSALSASQVTSLNDQQSKEPVYQVLVNLDSQRISLDKTDEPLKPGMVLEADMLLESRRLYEWILSPLYGVGHRISSDTPRG